MEIKYLPTRGQQKWNYSKNTRGKTDHGKGWLQPEVSFPLRPIEDSLVQVSLSSITVNHLCRMFAICFNFWHILLSLVISKEITGYFYWIGDTLPPKLGFLVFENKIKSQISWVVLSVAQMVFMSFQLFRLKTK